MENSVFILKNKLKDKNRPSINKKLDKIMQNYSIYHISNPNDFTQNQNIINNIKESKAIIINLVDDSPNQENFQYLIIGFQNTILIIKSTSIFLLSEILLHNSNLNICFMSESKEIFDSNLQISYNEIKYNKNFELEIYSFNHELYSFRNSPIESIWDAIKPCISGFIIKQSYFNLTKNRIDELCSDNNSNLSNKYFNKSDFIELRTLGISCSSIVTLNYHIEYGKLYAIKAINSNQDEQSKLINREMKNYSKIQFPLMPHFYGVIESLNYYVIEFINGQELSKIEQMNFSNEDKITILFELMIIIEYIHRNNFVYRDLKPNNIIIDDFKNAVLIDYDRMINSNEIKNRKIFTNDFFTPFMDPNVNTGNYTNKSDIYSLGQMMYFMITEQFPKDSIIAKIEDFGQFPEMYEIYKKCIDENEQKRPSITKLIPEFFFVFHSQIRIKNIFIKCENYFKDIFNDETMKTLKNLGLNKDDPNYQYELGCNYFDGDFSPPDIKKAFEYFMFAANKNHPKAQFALGVIYLQGMISKQDINKAIYYFTLSANQNNPEAQYNLGIFYLHGEIVKQDIDKAIYYFTLAANQNYEMAQYNLGLIYSNGKYKKIESDKAIHYLELASNQNFLKAKIVLAHIYYENQIVPCNINKTLELLLFAAEQDDSDAQSFLGLIYYNAIHVKRDMNKAIKYFTLAADKNDPKAQFNLGLVYSNGKYCERDINKAIKYYTLSSNQGYSDAQFNLAMLYYDGFYTMKDIEKAIQLFTRAANLKNFSAQFMLGVIYSEGIYVRKDMNLSLQYYELSAKSGCLKAQNQLGLIYKYKIKDINKSIYYFTLAAKQNYGASQFSLALIYSDGIYIKRDMNKAIQYYSLAAKNNIVEALNNLGEIYYNGNYVEKDIEKAIYYFSLAAKQNFIPAEYNLGCIYLEIKNGLNKAIEFLKKAANNNHLNAQLVLYKIFINGKIMKPDIDTAFYYLQLALHQKSAEAQYYMGFYLCNGIYLKKDIKKGIEYLILSANNKCSDAELFLGLFLINGIMIKQNINKGINYILKSAENNNAQACFAAGYLYFTNVYLNRNINKSVYYYKIASYKGYIHSKNNLGILYKNWIEITENFGIALRYFEDAIKLENDPLAMYNLANIYLYEIPLKQNIDKAIDLLINSALLKFNPSLDLLCLAILKKFQFNFVLIKNEIDAKTNGKNKMSSQIYKMIINKKLYDHSIYQAEFQRYKDIQYIYDFFGNIVFSSIKNKDSKSNTKNILVDINQHFYNGFYDN